MYHLPKRISFQHYIFIAQHSVYLMRQVRAKITNSRIRLAWSQPNSDTDSYVRPWIIALTSLSSLLVYKMRMIIVPPSQGWQENELR